MDIINNIHVRIQNFFGGEGRGSEGEYYCLPISSNFFKFQPFKGVGVGGSRPPTPL